MAESGEQVAVDPKENLEGEGNEPVSEKPAEAEPEKKPEEGHEDGSERRKPRRGGFQKKLERQGAEIEALKAQLEKKSDATGEPKPESYQTYDEFNEALIDSKARLIAKEIVDKELRERDERVSRESAAKSWKTKTEEARKTHADFDEVLAEFDEVAVRKDITDGLLESDLGADVAYYLATHPDELDAINHERASAVTIGRAIVRIESIIEGKKTGKAAVRTTSAPQPIVPLKGTAQSEKDISDDDISYEEHRRLRGYS